MALKLIATQDGAVGIALLTSGRTETAESFLQQKLLQKTGLSPK